MSFLSPLFLIGMAAAAVPVLLHFLRRQPEVRVRFPAVRLLRQAPVEQMSRRRLRELLLLALRVAALVLLSVAFARPFLASADGAPRGGVTIVALDTSLSLSAPGRMEAAQGLARDAIDAAPSTHHVGVLTFADAATVAAEPAADRGLAISAVSGAQAGAGSTRYRAALDVAVGLVTSHGDGTGRIVVVTDLQAGGWDEGDRVSLPESIEVDVADVGPLPPNLAVSAARADAERRVVATIANFGEQPREARVTLTADDRPAGERTVTIAAGQSADVAFEQVEGERVSVAVGDAEGLQGDNVRYVAMTRRGPPVVLVVTATGDLDREAFYVRQALAASGAAGAAFSVEGAAASALATWDATRLEGVAAVVLVSTQGLDRRGRELLSGVLDGGGGVLLAVGPTIDAEVAAGFLGGDVSIAVPSPAEVRDPRGAGRAIVPVDGRHPVFRTVGAGALGAATFGRISGVDSIQCQTIARFTTGEPALVDCGRGAGRVLVFASDLDLAWNDLPRRVAFVPFLHEAVRYLAGGRPTMDELLVGQSPAAGPPGLILRPGPGGERLVAVNVDPGESEPTRLTRDAFREGLTVVPAGVAAGVVEARQQEDRQNIWRYALLAMIAMLIAESALASRAA